MPTLPIGAELPKQGDRCDVEFDGGTTYEGAVTQVRKRSFTVHFECDGTDALVHVSKHRYRILPKTKRRRLSAEYQPPREVDPPDKAAKASLNEMRAQCTTTDNPARDESVAASTSGKSEYERLREQKIAANEAMLRQLGLIGAGSVTQSLKQVVRAKPRAPRVRAPRISSTVEDLRRSKRDRSSSSKTGYNLISLDMENTPRRARLPQPVDTAAIAAAEQSAGAAEGETFTKVMTPSMVEYSFKFGIGAAGAAVLPVYGSSPGGNRKMICWLVADEDSFGAAAIGSEGMEWPCVYHDHSKNFDGGWQGFAKAHELRTGDVCVFERLPDKFEPARDSGGFIHSDLARGWVMLRVILHRGGASASGVSR
jgi:hypothetical protein